MNKAPALSCLLILVVMAGMFFPPASRKALADDAASLPEACRLAPVAGECKALLTIYYYDQERNACSEAFHGGCGGVVPFQDQDECRAACETQDELRMHELRKLPEQSAARLVVSYPAKWEQPVLLARINGAVADYETINVSTTSERVVVELLVTLAEDRVRRIAVETTHGEKTFEAFAAVHW